MSRFQYQQLGSSPFSAAPAAAPDLSWSPTCPGPTRRLSSAAALAPAFFAVFALAQLPVPANAWEAKYPARAPSRPGLHASQQQAFAYTSALPNLAVPSLSWKAVHPDAIARRSLRPEQQQAYAHTIAIPNYAVPALAWSGAFPDRIQFRRPALQGHQDASAALRSDAAAPAPDLSWSPSFPSRLWARQGAPQSHQDASAALRADAATQALAWKPSHPDQVAPRRVLHGPWSDAAAALRADTPTLAPLTWLSEYPDLMPRKAPRREGVSVEPVIIIPALLSWAPSYPAWSTKRSLPSSEQLSHAYVPALAQLAPPALSWSPFYPTLHLRPRGVQLFLFGFNAAPIYAPAFPPVVTPPERTAQARERGRISIAHYLGNHLEASRERTCLAPRRPRAVVAPDKERDS